MKSDQTPLDAWQFEDALRLKKLFDSRQPKISQADFGAQFEIGSQGMVWQYLAARRPLNIKAATAFARGLNVRIEEFSPTIAAQIGQAASSVSTVHLSQDQGGGYSAVVVAEDGDPDFYQIPKVQLQLSAGLTGFQTVPDIHDGSKLSVAKNWVDRNGYNPSCLLAITVKGDSMEPNLYEGDRVIINTADTKMSDGVVFAVNYEGQAVVKRLARERGEWWLTSDNQDQQRYRPKSCRSGECIIVGRVVRRETDRI